MALTRSQKEAVVGAVAERLREAEAVVLTDYRGLNVAQISQLRRRMRDAGAEFRVVKNTLLERAFRAAELELPANLLEGPTAVALFFEDLAGPAKALSEFAAETQILTIKGGLMGGRPIDTEMVKTLAQLPTRDEVMAQLVGTLSAPMRQYVALLATPLRNFVNVLNARAQEAEAS